MNGTVSASRLYDPAGTLLVESIEVQADIPSRDGFWGTAITLKDKRGAKVSAKEAGRRYFSSGASGGFLPRQMEFRFSRGGVPLFSLPVGRKDLSIGLGEDQAALLLDSTTPIKVEVVPGQPHWQWQFDPSGFAGLKVGGLPALADQARSLMDKAETLKDPPCLPANSRGWTDGQKPLAFECHERWVSAVGRFETSPWSVEWQHQLAAGIWLQSRFMLKRQPDFSRVDFFDLPDRSHSWDIQIVRDEVQDPNKQTHMSDLRVEFRKRERSIKSWEQTDFPVGGFAWKNMSHYLSDDGEVSVEVADKEGKALASGKLPNGWRSALYAELRKGLARLRQRESDPFANCAVRVEYDSMEIIV